MSTIVVELYEAFRSAGVDDDKAKAAAGAVVGGEGLATKLDIADLRREMAELESRLIRWNVGTMIISRKMELCFAARVQFPEHQ